MPSHFLSSYTFENDISLLQVQLDGACVYNNWNPVRRIVDVDSTVSCKYTASDWVISKSQAQALHCPVQLVAI